MSFLGPLFLAGALAIGLPLWLHLLQRENPIRLPFASTRFFEKRKQSTLLHRKFRYLLLMGLRLALLLLIALAFAKPIWERAATTAVDDIPALHLIVLDTSLSMTHADRWGRAVAEAEAVIDDMSPADQAQILTTGPSVGVVTDKIRDRAELLAALASLKPGPSRNSYGDVVEAARSLAPDADVPVELHLITDVQSSAMPGRFSDLVLPTAATLDIRNVAGDNDWNWAIESVRGTLRLGTLRLAGAEKSRLDVTVGGFALEATRKTVTLRINGADVASLSQEIPAMGRQSFVFEDFEAPEGFSRAEVVLTPADDLPADDRRWIALDNSPPAPILFVTGDRRRRDGLYYRSALGASSAAVFDVRVSSPGEAARLKPSDFALVVLSDTAQLGTAFESALEDYVESGGSVLIAVGPQIAALGRTPLTGHRVAPSPLGGGGTFTVAGRVDATHPALGRVERFRGVKFFRYARIATEEGDETPLALADGSPLVVERAVGQGRVVLFASTFDNVWNDLPIQPIFVPFCAETARYLSGAAEQDRQALVDQSYELRRRRDAGSTIQVFDPNGDRTLSLSESVSRSDLPLDLTGFYELRSPNGVELIAVNPDPRESNLRSVDADTLALWRNTGRVTGRGPGLAAGAEGEETSIRPPPIRLWKLLLLLLAAIVLIESVVGNRHLMVRREV